MKTTKNFFRFSRVLTVVFSMAMCLTILSSCDEAATAVETKSAPITPTPEPVEKVDSVDYTYNPQDGGAKVINDDYTTINGQEIAAPGFAKLELAEHVVKLFGEDLPSLDNAAAIANAASQLNRTTRISGRDTIFVTTLSSSIANGKNIATTTSETVRPVRYIDGKFIAGAYLVTDQIVYTNINIVGAPATRSEWVLADEFNVAVGVDVVRHEAGLTHRAARTNLVQHLADTFRVEKYVKNDIISWRVVDSTRIATTYTDEYAKYNIEYTKVDGEKFNGDIMLPMNYFVKPTALPEAIVNNFNFNLFNKGNVVWENNEALVKTTETTKVYERHGSYASEFSNGVESFNTLYNTMNQRTVYNDGLVSLSTGYAEMAVAEKESSVANVQSDRDGYLKGIFTNNIEASYLNMAQPVQENKVLYMVKPAVDEIISKGWDKSSKNKWFKADSTICEANWVIKHTLKEDEVFHYRMAIPRVRKPMTDWRAVVKQFIQSTAEAQKPQTTSNAESKTTNDGLAVWRWQRVEGSCSAYTTADQAVEENSIYFLEANSISVTREGETLDFGEDELNIDHNYGKLGAQQTVANGTEVPFTLTWYYKYGNDNRRNIETPGILFKEKENDEVTFDFLYETKNKWFTPTTVEVEVKGIEKHSLGDDVEMTFKNSYPRTATVGQLWTAYVSEFVQNTDSRSLNKTQSNESSTDKNGATWNAVKEIYDIKAYTNITGVGVLPQANTLSTTEYNKITVSYKGKTVDFGEDQVVAGHDGGKLGTVYKVGQDEACDYTLGWNYGFGSDKQNFTSNGKLIKKATDIVTGDWDYSSKKKTITPTTIEVSVNWVEKHTLGNDVVTTYKRSYPRTSSVGAAWSEYVSEFSQNTDSRSLNKTQSTETANDNGAVWSAVKESYAIKANTNLVGVGVLPQANTLNTVEFNDIKLTREGKVVEFGIDAVSANHDGGKLGSIYKVGNDEACDYTLGWNYGFGSSNQNFTSNGKLMKKATDIVTGDWDYSSKKKTITPTTIDVEIKWVEKHSLKDDVVTTYRKSYPRSASVGQAWSVYVSEFYQNTGNYNLNKNQATETSNDNNAVWSAVKESYNISATTSLKSGSENNTLNTVEYNSITLTREGRTVEFGVDAVSVSHNSGKLGSEYTVSDGKAKDYTLGWNYGFGSDKQSFTSNGKLIVKETTPDPKPTEEEDKVLSAGWDNAKEVMTDNGYTLDIDWVVKHSKKADEVTHYNLPLSRDAKCTTNWSATVSRLHQSTGASTAKKTSSSNQSKADGAATWNWVAETYSVVTKTSLTGADAQVNEIVANECNSVSITREGKTYSWKKKGIAAPHDNGHLTKVNDKQYSYELVVKYNFGTNVKEISCPGKLNLK